MKTSRSINTLLAGLALCLVFATGASAESGEDQSVIEAVFRYQLQQRLAEHRWKIFYLAVGMAVPSAPSDEFMSRFENLSPKAKKFVAAEYDANAIRREQGLVLGVGEVKMKSETEAEVEGYYFEVPGEAQGFSFLVVREEGKWVVKSCKGTWVT